MRKELLTCALAASLSAISAHAVPLNITINSSGALLHSVGIADDTQYKAITGTKANNPTDNLGFLDHEISLWDAVPKSPTLGPPTMTGFLDLGNSGNFTSANHAFAVKSPAAGTFDYVVFHFGAGPAGAGQGGGWWETLYIGGLDISTLSFSLPKVGDKYVGGISSARFFNDPPRTPDGGSTVVLLALGLGLLSGESLRRKLHKT